MGVDTKIYFANRVSPTEIANAIQKEFGVAADLSNIKFEAKKYEDDFDRHYGYIRFTSDGISYHWYFYQFNRIYGGDRDGTNNDTMSSDCCEENKTAMKRIGKYFGGWLDENDCDDEKHIYIDKTEGEIELSSYQVLEQLVCSEIDYKYAQKVMEFIGRNQGRLVGLICRADFVK